MTPNQVVDSAGWNTLSLRKFESMKVCSYVAFDLSLKSGVVDSAGCGTLSLTQCRYIIDNLNLLLISALCSNNSCDIDFC